MLLARAEYGLVGMMLAGIVAQGFDCWMTSCLNIDIKSCIFEGSGEECKTRNPQCEVAGFSFQLSLSENLRCT